jgi:hypothetical protein
MTISRHPGSSAGTLPSLAVSPTRDETFRSMCLPTVSPADPRSELGPRSLDPAALFGARMPSLFETSRRLPTSATAFDVRATKPGLFTILAGTETSISFLFSTRHAPSLAGGLDR